MAVHPPYEFFSSERQFLHRGRGVHFNHQGVPLHRDDPRLLGESAQLAFPRPVEHRQVFRKSELLNETLRTAFDVREHARSGSHRHDDADRLVITLGSNHTRVQGRGKFHHHLRRIHIFQDVHHETGVK